MGVKGMVEVPFSAIEDAFYFVSSQSYGMEAYLCTNTGQLYYRSEMGEIDELPEDFEESDCYIRIPHKKELDLGRRLVDRFMVQKAPDLSEEVAQIFRRKGAYARFKLLLQSNGLLEAWYQFENDETKRAIKQWCLDNDIPLKSETSL